MKLKLLHNCTKIKFDKDISSKMNHAVKLNSYLTFVKEGFCSFLNSNLTILKKKKKSTVSYKQ